LTGGQWIKIKQRSFVSWWWGLYWCNSEEWKGEENEKGCVAEYRKNNS